MTMFMTEEGEIRLEIDQGTFSLSGIFLFVCLGEPEKTSEWYLGKNSLSPHVKEFLKE